MSFNIEEIRSHSKFTYNKLIKSCVEKLAFNYLINEKNKQQKCSVINYQKLSMQEYLTSPLLNTVQKKILFQMRTKTYPVYQNIKFMVEDTRCPCCLLRDISNLDTMEHQLLCDVINVNNSSIVSGNVNIDMIYSEQISKQAEITRIFEEAMRKRKKILGK